MASGLGILTCIRLSCPCRTVGYQWLSLLFAVPARRYLPLYELWVREFIQVPVSSCQAGGGTSRHPLAHRLQPRHCRGGMFLSSRLLIENRFRPQRCRLAG